MLLLVHVNMPLSTEIAFYHKVGSISDEKTVFKYFLSSTSPHFYFVVYVVPYENIVDIFYIPKVDNVDSFSVVPLFDSLYGEVKGLEYGETATIVLANEKISGMAEVVEVEISIPLKPIVRNDILASPLDLALARQTAREAADILELANLYTLSNQLMIIVESKVKALVDSSSGVNIEAATYSIIQQLLLDKSVLYNSLPSEMITEQKEVIHRLLNTVINLSPYSTDIVVMFSDIVTFSTAMYDGLITFEDIPYNVFYRLAYSVLVSESTDSVADIGVAAGVAVKEVSIGLNMVTMEEESKVYEFLNATQGFVYLTSISFRNIESGDIKTITLNNIDPDLLTRKKDICVEARSIQSQDKQVTIQYGYGSGCDLFIGILFKDSFGSYGITREDKLLDGDTETSRLWSWGESSLEMFGNEIDSSNNIEITFTGV